jgi:hypothetical protein
MNRSEAGKLGYKKSLAHILKFIKSRRKIAFINFKKKNKKCLCCKRPIIFEKRNNKFCNHRCAGLFNNKKPYSVKTIRKCLNCEKPLPHWGVKYCSPKCQIAVQWKNKKKIIEEKGFEKTNTVAKKFIIEKRGRKCEICGRRKWRGKLIPIILDHIDGNSMNSNLTNLRIICPNCDAQLPTFTGRNRGHGRESRRKFYKKHGYS